MQDKYLKPALFLVADFFRSRKASPLFIQFLQLLQLNSEKTHQKLCISTQDYRQISPMRQKFPHTVSLMPNTESYETN
jgi:hypothetical protein